MTGSEAASSFVDRTQANRAFLARVVRLFGGLSPVAPGVVRWAR
jgi:hypothetical protein